MPYLRLVSFAVVLLSSSLSADDVTGDARPAEFSSLQDLREFEATLIAKVHAVRAAVVGVWAEGTDRYLGSGVVVSPEGMVLTHGHHDHTDYDARFEVRFGSGTRASASMTSMFSAGSRDLSVLQLEGEGPYPHVNYQPQETTGQYDRCFLLGYPNNLPKDAQVGPLLRYGRIAASTELVVYANCLALHGDSGGPLFNLEGTVLGTLTSVTGHRLSDPGVYTSIAAMLRPGAVFMTEDRSQVRKLGLLNRRRATPETFKQIPSDWFADASSSARRSTAEIVAGDERLSLATCIAPGILVTKASEVGLRFATDPAATIPVRLHDETTVDAEAIGHDDANDLLFLRVAENLLPEVRWNRKSPSQGTFVAVTLPGCAMAPLGVIGLEQPLDIPAAAGQVSIEVEEHDRGVLVTSDERELRQNTAGQLEQGDIVTQVGSEPVRDVATFLRLTRRDDLEAGSIAHFRVIRSGREQDVRFACTSTELPVRFADVSSRRTGFVGVLTHDAVIDRHDCGGPVLDLAGTVIGVNVARNHRNANFMVPESGIMAGLRAAVETR